MKIKQTQLQESSFSPINTSMDLMDLMDNSLNLQAFNRRNFACVLSIALTFFALQIKASPQCSAVFGTKLSPATIRTDTSENYVFYMEQAHPNKDQPFSFQALYDPKSKSIKIEAYLADREQGIRSQIQGREAYAQMMEHFSNYEVLVIRGNWSYSDNSTAYIHNKQKLGMSSEEAALNTWSGAQAKKYGYGIAKVTFEGMIEGSNGRPRYKIDVDFYKEEVQIQKRWRDYFSF